MRALLLVLLAACGAEPAREAPPGPPIAAEPPTVAVPAKPTGRGPVQLVARFRADRLWERAAVDDAELLGLLEVYQAWPPGMKGAAPAKETAAQRATHPVWLELRRPTTEWLDAGGHAIVVGELPAGRTIRATLRGDAERKFEWVFEDGDGTGWHPLATVSWEK